MRRLRFRAWRGLRSCLSLGVLPRVRQPVRRTQQPSTMWRQQIMFVYTGKFKVGDKVKTTGFSKVGEVTAVDPDDSEFPYEVEFVGKQHNITEIFAEYRLESANG